MTAEFRGRENVSQSLASSVWRLGAAFVGPGPRLERAFGMRGSRQRPADGVDGAAQGDSDDGIDGQNPDRGRGERGGVFAAH